MNASTTPTTDSGTRPAPTLPLILCWTVAVSALMAYIGYHQGQREMRGALANHPPVAVVDVAEIATHWKVGASASERVANGLVAAKSEAARLAGEGHIVLDAKNVLATPTGADHVGP